MGRMRVSGEAVGACWAVRAGFSQSVPLPKSHPVNVWQMCGINSWLLFHLEGQNLYFLSWFCCSKRNGGQIENIPGVGNKASIHTKSALQAEPGSECSRE